MYGTPSPGGQDLPLRRHKIVSYGCGPRGHERTGSPPSPSRTVAGRLAIPERGHRVICRGPKGHGVRSRAVGTPSDNCGAMDPPHHTDCLAGQMRSAVWRFWCAVSSKVVYSTDPIIKSSKPGSTDQAPILLTKVLQAHVINTYDTIYNFTTCSCSPRCHTCLTATLTSTGDSMAPIFENGRLKPGTYKIQNLYAQTYVDIHEDSRKLCCRPTQDLWEGKGIVRQYPLPAVRV